MELLQLLSVFLVVSASLLGVSLAFKDLYSMIAKTRKKPRKFFSLRKICRLLKNVLILGLSFLALLGAVYRSPRLLRHVYWVSLVFALLTAVILIASQSKWATSNIRHRTLVDVVWKTTLFLLLTVALAASADNLFSQIIVHEVHSKDHKDIAIQIPRKEVRLEAAPKPHATCFNVSCLPW